MIFNLSAQDWGQVDIIWFLEIDYLNKTYRFSTLNMDLLDADGKSYPYIGGLEDFAVQLSMGKVGELFIEDSVAIAVTFPNKNIAKDIYNGQVISGSDCVLGFVLVRNGEIQQSFETRQFVYKGIVTEPVYGFPDNDLGHVQFSIENKALISQAPLLETILGPNIYIQDVTITPPKYYSLGIPFPTLDDLVNVADIHRGKVLPFVFGNLTGILRENNNITNIPISPAYVVAYDSVAPKPCFYIIAGHVTNATTVRVSNNVGDTPTNPTVHHLVGADNRAYAYFSIDGTTFTWSNSVAANDDRQVWVEWDNGGGYPNPFGDGELQGGGDICLFLLQQVTEEIDLQAWDSVKDILNQYEFGGYVNDDKITVFQFLEKFILPFLPISITNGPKGLKPVLDLRTHGFRLYPRKSIITGNDWERLGPVKTETTPEDIINYCEVRYAVNGITNTMTARTTVSNIGKDTPIVFDGFDIHRTSNLQYGLSSLADISVQRYGVKKRIVDVPYVYHWRTAVQIANDIVQKHALEIKMVSYSAGLSYGFLNVGDIISITDDDLGFDALKAQIVSKVYDSKRWIFDIQIHENPYINQKANV